MVPPAVPQPAASAPPVQPAPPTIEWESLIGGKWALWVWSVAVFLATAFFLAYTWRYLPEAGRMAVGFAAGGTFLVIGGYCRHRAERWFSEGMTGAGLGLCYLTIWAGAQRYEILPFEIAFVLMALTTALGVTLAVRYDAVSLSVLATCGGFLTPALLQSGGSSSAHAMAFLTYVAVLNAGILAVSIFKQWRGIIWLSLVATILLVGGWSLDSYTADQRWPLFTFVTLYFLLFLGTSCFHSLVRRKPTAPEDLLLLFADAFVYALAGYSLLHGAIRACPGTFPLALAFFFALLAVATKALVPENVTLRRSAGGIALLFLTITIPIQLKQGWIAVGWSVQAAVLLSLGLRAGSPLLHRAGQAVWGLSLLRLLGVLLDAHPTPHLLFLNPRALPLLVSVLASGWMGLIARRNTRRQDDEPALTDELAPFYAVYATLAGAWLLAQETHLGLGRVHLPEPASWQAGALYVIACVLSIYAVAVFALGQWQRHVAFRFSALLVAALATVLPLWASLALPAANGTPFWNLRALSYLVVAVALGGLAWMTTRDRDGMEPLEVEALGPLPAFVSLFVLWGMTLETFASFQRSAIPSPDTWVAAALFAIAVLWSVFAFVMLLLGLTWKHEGLRHCGYVVGLLGSGLLLVNALGSIGFDWTPIVNLRCFAFAIVATVLVLATVIGRSSEADAAGEEGALAGRIKLLASVVVLWGLTQETYLSFRHWGIPSADAWQSAACFTLAMLWSGFALATFIFGVRRQQEEWRYLGYFTGIVALLGLLCTAFASRPDWAPFLNLRALAFATMTTALAVAATLARNREDDLPPVETGVAAGTTLLAGLVLLWGLTGETYEAARYYQSALGADWRMGAHFVIASLWCSFALGLLVLPATWRHSGVRLAAYWIGGLGIGLLLLAAMSATKLDWHPLFNARCLAFALAIATLSGAATVLRQRAADLNPAETELRGSLTLLALGLLLWALTQETYETCHHYRAAFGTHWTRWAQMAISLVWTLYGALLLISGIIRHYQPVRLIALGLLGLTVVKVFLFDLSFLDTPLRILSFGGLGLALIFISWLYGRLGVGRGAFGDNRPATN